MGPHRLVRSACLLTVFAATAAAQPALVEPGEFPQVQPGPLALYAGEACFLLAEGMIVPGDVDWIRVRLPRASSRTVVDVDFPTGAGASAMLAVVEGGTTGFNIADNNSTRDALCGLAALTSPVGSTTDSVIDLRETSVNSTIHIAVTGASDTAFVGLHMQMFSYQVWVYAEPHPCVNDASCDDGVACTLDVCNTTTGDCSNTADSSVCDDGVFCNGSEWCDQSLGCRSGARPECDDGVDCTDDYCDFFTDACANDPWDDYCDNWQFCDGFEYCDPEFGCRSAPPVDCDDHNACTADSCDEDFWECVHTPHDDCDDGVFCNGVESCDPDGGCQAGDDPCPGMRCRESDDRCVECLSASDCDDGQFCNGVEQCDPQGGCVPGQDPCVDSMCREADDQCVECLSDADCDDGQFCNGAEVCNAAGQCQDGGEPCVGQWCREGDDRCVDCLSDADCDDGVFCNGAESCDPDGNCAVAVYACGELMCSEVAAQCVECLADSDCDDGVYCNGQESCSPSGDCQEGSYPCGDAFCRESDDRCVTCLTDADCDDGLFCNGVEFCDDAGACAAGTSPCSLSESCNEETDACMAPGLSMDFRPGPCPARLMSNARGNLPVAVMGANLDQVVWRSLNLSRADGVGGSAQPEFAPQGQAPRFEDLSAPAGPCECSPDRDGMVDLVVSFKAEQLVHELRLDQLRSGSQVELVLTGVLIDGTPFAVSDCVVVQNVGRNGAGVR